MVDSARSVAKQEQPGSDLVASRSASIRSRFRKLTIRPPSLADVLMTCWQTRRGRLRSEPWVAARVQRQRVRKRFAALPVLQATSGTEMQIASLLIA